MHFAQVTSWDSPPTYMEGPDLPPPRPSQVRLKMLAAAVHRLVQMRAAGKHFTATTLPVDPSADAVGVDEETGKLYYDGGFAAPFLAEYANVDRARIFELPAGADAITVAALTNPVSSSWMALKERVVDLPKDFSVLILGVTGTSGRVAVSVARKFGAGKIIGVARNEAALKGIEGLDSYVVQKDPVEDTDFSRLGQVDVILDYVYGKAVTALFAALKPERETQYVNIGSIGGEETIVLPAQLFRARALRITGSAPGAWTMQAFGGETPTMVKMAAEMPRPADVYTRPLKDVEAEWNTEDARRKRLVLIP